MKRKVNYDEVPEVDKRILVLEKHYEKRYNRGQFEALIYGLSLQKDITPWADPMYTGNQMEILFETLEKGFDPTILANPEYTNEQMKEILIGIENNVEVQKFANPKYDAGWMRWLRLSLQKNIDIESYPEFYKTSTMAYLKYTEIVGKKREEASKAGKRKVIQVERIRRECYYMEVLVDETTNLKEIVEDLNNLKFSKILQVEDYLHTEGVCSIERRLLKPREGNENYLTFSLEEKNEND